MKFSLAVSVVAAALTLAAQPALAIPRPGDPAPPIALTTVDGAPLGPAAWRGKPVYLNFFATWCGPCRVETPSIVAVSQKYAHAGLMVVGVDVGENAGKAADFVHDFHVPYRIAVDPDSSTRLTYGGGIYFPIHVFIDAKGIVRTYHPGEMSAAEIDAAVKALLKSN
jgi:cytochrome c biogenesis protein CcmG/thiol:disulfide interchange protein DsbE